MMENFNLWRGRVDTCYGYQQKQHSLWKDTVDLYNCNYFNRIYGGSNPERIDVNFANWYLTNLVPLTYFRDPFIFIKGRNERYFGFAETLEEVVNISWGELDLKRQFKDVILSAFMMPPGWMKLGYTAQVGQDVGNIEKETSKSFLKEVKDALRGIVRHEKTEEEKGILDLNIKEESVFATWIPSWNVLVPPGYNSTAHMPYMIEVEDISKPLFLKNPLYTNKDKAQPSRQVNEKQNGGALMTATYHNSPGSPDESDNILRLYHIWDREGQRRLTISDNAQHFEGKWPYDMEGFPYKPLVFEKSLPQPNESNFYPPNAITPILPQIIEKSQARTMMVKYRKRAAAYMLVQKGLISEEEVDSLSESDMMQIIQVSNLAAVQAGTLPPLQPDIYNIDIVNDKDLQQATNMGQLMFQALPGQRTAAQAQIAQSGMQLKAEARVDVVEDFTTDTAKGLVQLMWQFYDRKKVSEIIGKPVTPEMWPDLPENPRDRRRIIQSEMTIKIDAGSTAPPKDETVERKQFIDAMSIAANIAPERLNKGEALKQLFKTFKYIKDLDKIVISSDDQEMQAAQRETQLMLQGAPQVVSPNENHMLHIQVHQQAQGNPLVDQHIIEHGNYLGITESGVGNKPQQGDVRPPMKSTNPEVVRQGAGMDSSDLMGSVNNAGARI